MYNRDILVSYVYVFEQSLVDNGGRIVKKYNELDNPGQAVLFDGHIENLFAIGLYVATKPTDVFMKAALPK